MKNRTQRRAEKSAFSKELRTAVFDEFESRTSEFLEIRKLHGKDNSNVIAFMKNSVYSVQIFRYDKTYVLGIRRHDQKAIFKWSHAQEIKNRLLGKNFTGYQIFPREKDLIDEANIYWLFCQQGSLISEFNLKNYEL